MSAPTGWDSECSKLCCAIGVFPFRSACVPRGFLLHPHMESLLSSCVYRCVPLVFLLRPSCRSSGVAHVLPLVFMLCSSVPCVVLYVYACFFVCHPTEIFVRPACVLLALPLCVLRSSCVSRAPSCVPPLTSRRNVFNKWPWPFPRATPNAPHNPKEGSDIIQDWFPTYP